MDGNGSMKKILIVVDYQYDFYHPDGALYVPGAEKLYDNILKIIPNFDGVIFTLDDHPINHCSFRENGGIWPLHCVEGTQGASIPLEFVKQAKNYVFEYKGMLYNAEEYGAFNIIENLDFTLDLLHTFIEDCEFVICGVAGDYCVYETLKNLIRHCDGTENIKLYLNGIVSIDDGYKLKNFIFDNHIEIYDPE